MPVNEVCKIFFKLIIFQKHLRSPVMIHESFTGTLDSSKYLGKIATHTQFNEGLRTNSGSTRIAFRILLLDMWFN